MTSLAPVHDMRPRYLVGGSHLQTDNFGYIDWDELCLRAENPVQAPKHEAPIFAPFNAPAKTKAAALSHNNYTLLIADLDEGSPRMLDIWKMLKSAGLCSFIIYSTASHQAEGRGNRWRVCVEITQGIDVDHWGVLQAYLGELLGGDDCTARAQQVSYLPNIGPGGYAKFIQRGEALDPFGDAHPFIQRAVAFQKAQQEQLDRIAASKPPAAPRKTVSLSEGQVSPIDAYNQAYDIEDLLQRYGYRKRGLKWLHPKSSSGSPGVVLLDGRYYSHHSQITDALADEHVHDCFDLYVCHEHNGDFNAALKAAGESLQTAEGISLTSHNQRSLSQDQARRDDRHHSEPTERAEPLPLLSPPPPAAVYPLAALGPILGPAAKAIADCVQCPDAMAGQSVLAAAALATQGFSNVLIDGRSFPASLFCLTVAESGDRKSGADKLALYKHRLWQQNQQQVYNEQMAGYQADSAAYKTIYDQAKNKKKTCKEAIAKELKELGLPPQEPPSPNLIMREPTYEAIQKGFRYGLPSQGLFSDEGGQFFGGHAMNRDNQLKTIAGLSALWDGGPIVRNRAENGESFALHNRRLSTHLMVQPIVAESVLSSPLMAGQGFMARFLLVWTDSIAGTRLYNHLDPSKEPALIAYNQTIQGLLDLEYPTDENGDPAPVDITLAEDAKAFWVDAYDTIEAALAASGALHEIKPTASKASENMARIAAVLTLSNNPNATTIPLPDMKRASQLSQFYLQEALRLNQVAETDINLTRAKVLLDWMHGEDIKWVSMTQLARSAPRGTKARGSVNAMRRLMAILADHYWVYRLPEGFMVEGKPTKEAWEVVRV